MSASFARRGNHAQVQQHDAIADHESNGRGRGDIPRDEGERGADAMRDNTHQLTNELSSWGSGVFPLIRLPRSLAPRA